MSNRVFAGTEQFQVVRRLGAGGMGVVYEVQDRHRGARVALKILHRNTADDRRLLKAEFRSLSDIAHPNLVTLHELFAETQECFFTMELIDGMDFVEHLLKHRALDSEDTLIRKDRLGQLAEGVQALHDAGLLHRDLKPSNVRVANDGRVVILDFGLARDLTDDAGPRDELAGTPAYMAPEQLRGLRATPSSDWYAFGAVLYEVLTGSAPFAGTKPWALVSRKQSETVPPPSCGGREVDSELEQLSIDLLDVDPRRRPTGREILDRLKGGARPRWAPGALPRSRDRGDLVDRVHEMEALRSSFDSSLEGKPVVVVVSGEAGIGKSALVGSFLRDCRRERDAVVLAGRCHEREQLPYKAFDGIVDALAAWMASRDPDERAELLPAGIDALTRIFPVLGEASQDGDEEPGFSAPMQDDRELRRAGFRAFRELVRAVSLRHPIVLHADDVQWADADSVGLLEELLGADDSPRFLFIATHRDESPPNAFLQALSARAPLSLPLAALGPQDARTLAHLCLGSLGDEGGAMVDRVANESGGSPLFLGQIASYLLAAGTDAESAAPVSVSHVVRSRAGLLPEEAQRVLEVVALAGAPLPVAAVLRASRAGPSGSTVQLLEQLCFVQLARGSPSGHDLLSVFHDRIGEAVYGGLPEERARTLHLELATALNAIHHADSSAIARHYRLGGEVTEARRHALAAATKAASALAFLQAADLYRTALELGSADATDRRDIQRKLGDALVNAGRGRDAAQALRAAATGAPVNESLELRRRAAEQLLITGDIESGLSALREVLLEVGLTYPDGSAATLAAFLAIRTRLRLRGLDFRERRAEEISADTLLRVDSCRAVAWPLSMVDLARSALFDTRHLFLALEAGEPRRIGVALVSHATFVSTGGVKTKRRALDLLRRARSIMESAEEPYHRALFLLLRGLTLTHFSEWQEPLPWIRRAERIFSEECRGVTWELDFARALLSRSLGELGLWAEQSEHLGVWLDDARERGDDYFAATLRVFHGHDHWLAMDDPARAGAEIEKAERLWPSVEFNAQKLAARFASAQIDLYAGRPLEAFETSRALRSEFKGTMLRFHEVSSIMVRHVVAASALAMAEAGHSRSAMLDLAEGEAKALEIMGSGYTESAAASIVAGIASVRGNRVHATEGLERAARELGRCGRAMHAAAARFHLGHLIGGSHGASIADEGATYMSSQGVKRPDRVARMLLPGFGG